MAGGQESTLVADCLLPSAFPRCRRQDRTDWSSSFLPDPWHKKQSIKDDISLARHLVTVGQDDLVLLLVQHPMVDTPEGELEPGVGQ